MQHQQQDVGGGGGGGPQYGGEAGVEMVITDEDHKLGDLGIAEAASPISSRPPAPSANFEEMLQATAEAGGSSGNRWPRQETLALLQIRSEMDAAFRDATLKGPLWEQVSRKLAELGYKRSAKKCKEKFENVHKYYKRTKEGRGGRQDGKSYKFFTQLEALNFSTATATAAAPVMSLPPPIPQPAAILSLPPPAEHESAGNPMFGGMGMSLSVSSSSSEDDDELETESTENRKRKRSSTSGGGDGDERMMDFFEGLLKQVMQKQEGMQQKFLEAIEKREHDRMIREEAWKRQDMARIAREHDLMAHERAVSASRDAAIVAFLEKITGQTIHLPTAPPPPAPPPPPPPPQPAERIQSDHGHGHVVAAVPEQQMMIPHQDLSSSRWPKAEVLALIQLRSGMDSKYQESGPKGVLWEEISGGMQRMGYNRSAKRCKEKWENINKYFKKVKESNKKRPEDAKTCPYFHELDALYRKKALGNQAQTSAAASGAFSSAPFGGGDDDIGGEKQPEDMLIKKQNQESRHGDMMDKCSNSSNSGDNYEDLVEENEEEYDDDDDNKTEEEMKLMYKIQFQRPNHVGSSNGGGMGTGTGAPSSSTFLAMVQ